MHFVDAWTSLAPLDLLLLIGPPAIALGLILLPGRTVARTASLGLAFVSPVLPEFGPALLRVGWFTLWLAVAIVAGLRREPSGQREASRPGGVESGALGLLLGAALLVPLIVALGRQDLPPEVTRPAAAGLVLVMAGLAQLMLRRDALRATVSFATIGLGLQWLDRAVRSVVLDADATPQGAMLFATAIAVALAARVAWVRQRDAGSAWVSHAHDLHD